MSNKSISSLGTYLAPMHVHIHGTATAKQRAGIFTSADKCVTRRKQHRPGIAPDANTTHDPNRRKQCSPSETKSYSNPTPPRKRQNTPTNGHTPYRMKPTHTRLTYTRMRPHRPSHQAGDHPVPAHTERHNPLMVQTQRQSGLPPRAASSQGQRHRCRSIRKQSI